MARRSLLSISFQIHQSHYHVHSTLQTHSAFTRIGKQLHIDATFILAARNYYSTKLTPTILAYHTTQLLNHLSILQAILLLAF